MFVHVINHYESWIMMDHVLWFYLFDVRGNIRMVVKMPRLERLKTGPACPSSIHAAGIIQGIGRRTLRGAFPKPAAVPDPGAWPSCCASCWPRHGETLDKTKVDN